MPTDEEDIQSLLDSIMEGIQLPDLPPVGILQTDWVGAHTLVIETPKGAITIHGNGDVVLPSGVTPNEAAVEFWRHIHLHGSKKEEHLFNQVQMLEKLVHELEEGINNRNNAISRLCKELDDLKGNGQKRPDTNRFEDLMEDEDGGNRSKKGSKLPDK